MSPLGSRTGMGLPGESSGHPRAVGLVLRVELPSEVSQQACFLQNTQTIALQTWLFRGAR